MACLVLNYIWKKTPTKPTNSQLQNLLYSLQYLAEWKQPQSSVCSRNNKVHTRFWMKFLFRPPASEVQQEIHFPFAFHHHPKLPSTPIPAAPEKLTSREASVLGFHILSNLVQPKVNIHGQIRVRGNSWGVNDSFNWGNVQALCGSDMLLGNILGISLFFCIITNLDWHSGPQQGCKAAHPCFVHLTFPPRCNYPTVLHGFASSRLN